MQDGDAAADGEVLVGLRPHNTADMRAFLSLSAFLSELLPLLGAPAVQQVGRDQPRHETAHQLALSSD